MSYHLGVDLGTTYTAAALARDGRAEPVTLGTSSVAVPSVVYVDGGHELVVGQPAVRRAATEPSRVAREFKRRVGDPTPVILDGTPVPAEMLMARLLGWVVQQVAATEGRPPASLALCHPANWGAYKLDLLTQAVRHVGLRVDHLVPEPVAAATFYASQRELPPEAVVAVYDLGGGTFDASLVRAGAGGFRIIGQPDGIERLGGIDFDYAVLRHVTDAAGIDLDGVDASDSTLSAAVSQLRQSCVEAKEALSSDTDVSVPVMLPTRHTEVRLTRGELEGMIRPAIEETLVALRRTIGSAGITPEQVHAVLLVGGSSRIPLVGQLVMAGLNRPVAVDARPKDAVPLGAALAAAAAAAGPSDTSAGATRPEPGPPASPVPPPAAADSPSPVAGVPAATTGPSRRRWLVAAALLAMAGLAGLVFLLSQDDDGSETAGTTTTSEPTGDPVDGEDGGGDDTLPDLGAVDIDDLSGALGAGSGSGEQLDPLPGDDWSDDARAQFVGDCAAGDIGSAASMAGVTPDELCGCIYDGASSSGVGFDEFNEAWTADTIDHSHPGTQALADATLGCAGGI